MINDSLSEQLEYAILETVVQVFNGHQQDIWGGWEHQVTARGLDRSGFTPGDVVSAFRRLREGGILRLTKPDVQRAHAREYSDEVSDDFFLVGPFNAVITDGGRRYWDSIREKPRHPIGFFQLRNRRHGEYKSGNDCQGYFH
jgi:hypothetical protein